MSDWKRLSTGDVEILWHSANNSHFSDRAKGEWETACASLRLEAAFLSVSVPMRVDVKVFLKVQRQVIEAHQNRDIVEAAMKTYETV